VVFGADKMLSHFSTGECIVFCVFRICAACYACMHSGAQEQSSSRGLPEGEAFLVN